MNAAERPSTPAAGTVATDALDARHAWHPFTQMREYLANPRVHIVRGEGCRLIDTEGRGYLDGTSSLWTNVHGHNHPELNAAIVEQLGRVAHTTMLGFNHPPAAALAEKLAGLTGGALPRCFYTDNGSCAVEVALKLSLQYRQLAGEAHRTGIIAMENAYHGDTFGTMSVGDCGVFHGRFKPWFFPCDRFPSPDYVEFAGRVTRDRSADSLAALERLLAEKGATTSCLILEPGVQGSGGMLLQPPGFVKRVAELCRRHGVHLILDEVFTGFGRTGDLLVSHREGVTPDLLVLAKGLTAGYLPLAATLCTEAIYEKFLGAQDEWRALYHGHTFTGNPLGCAVALKSLELLEPLVASGELRRKAGLFGKLVAEHFENHPNVSEIRQRGFVAALDLKPARPGETWSTNDRTGYRVCLAARKHGLLIRPLGDTVLLVPPPAMSDDELRRLCAGTLAAMCETLQGNPESAWAFKCDEISANQFRVRGLFQNHVAFEKTGGNPDELLEDARAYSASLPHGPEGAIYPSPGCNPGSHRQSTPSPERAT